MKCTTELAAYRPGPAPVATIGNFDGLHRGHLALLASVVAAARARQGTALVLTFDPHPVTVLHPGATIRFLTSREDKLRLLESVGIDEVLFLRFDRELAALSPEAFVRTILHQAVGVRELFVGEHFAFGKGRAGRIADLRQYGERLGMQIHAVPPTASNGTVVSSTRIRALVQSGDVREAGRLLGRAYHLTGPVIHGAQRGHALGWPTANLRLPPDRVIPADGVYATIAKIGDVLHDAVSYIGTRPTFGAGERLLEVSVLDTTLDLYGETLEVRFIDRVRADMTFASADELSARIDLDAQTAREMLKNEIACQKSR